ncbi:MAG: GGDEF domain-containing protein [Clostridia bacterium]|nr:GGDEF domain-containing protein [Clostridia bacterium]
MDKRHMLAAIDYFKTIDLSGALDPLTKALRREVIMQYAHWLIARKHTFAMLMVDIDNFKNVNDIYGHEVGDQVLYKAANYLIDVFGSSAVVGRFGGDEFLILMDGVEDYDVVWELCHRINLGAVDLTFEGYPTLALSFTIGAVRCPKDGDNFNDLFKLMDKALYRGKTKGRNCFIIYLPEKHKNLFASPKIKTDIDSMYLHARVFHMLNVSDDMQFNVKLAVDALSDYLMIDHLCVQSSKDIYYEHISPISKSQEFKFIDGSLIDETINSVGVFYVNKIEQLKKSSHAELYDVLAAQNIKSVLWCKIDCRDKTFGYLRADMADTIRIWQTVDMNILISAAKCIGMALYLRGTDLETKALPKEVPSAE